MTTGVRLATADQIAIIYHRRRSYVFRLACIHQWDRIKYGGRTYYRVGDADKVLGKPSELSVPG